MALRQKTLQGIRRLHVWAWRKTRFFYWNGHPGTCIPPDARVATTARLELETGGSVRLGLGCQLTHNTVIAPYGGTVELHDRVYIGHNTVIYGHGGVSIGQDTMLAANVVIVAMSHTYNDPNCPISQQPITKAGVKVGANCWIGAGVTILDGLEVGANCVIGAGTVVTKSIPPDSIAVGVPARVTGSTQSVKL